MLNSRLHNEMHVIYLSQLFIQYYFNAITNINKRPRGLDACHQHCKISATDVTENVYLCSKMHYHEKKICIGLYIYILYPIVCTVLPHCIVPGYNANPALCKVK